MLNAGTSTDGSSVCASGIKFWMTCVGDDQRQPRCRIQSTILAGTDHRIGHFRAAPLQKLQQQIVKLLRHHVVARIGPGGGTVRDDDDAQLRKVEPHALGLQRVVGLAFPLGEIRQLILGLMLLQPQVDAICPPRVVRRVQHRLAALQPDRHKADAQRGVVPRPALDVAAILAVATQRIQDGYRTTGPCQAFRQRRKRGADAAVADRPEDIGVTINTRGPEAAANAAASTAAGSRLERRPLDAWLPVPWRSIQAARRWWVRTARLAQNAVPDDDQAGSRRATGG